MSAVEVEPGTAPDPVTDHGRPLQVLVAGQRRSLLVLFSLVVLTTSCVQVGPLLVAWAVDHAGGEHTVRVVVGAAATYLTVNVVAAITARRQLRLASRVAEAMIAGLRERLFTHMLRLGHRYFERTADGALISRLTGDVEVLAIFLRTGMVAVLTDVLVLGVTTAFMVVLSPLLAGLVLLVTVPPAVVATRWFVRRAGAVNNRMRAAVATATGELNEGITGMAVVRRFGRENDQMARYRDLDDTRVRAAADGFDLGARYSAIMDAIGVLAYVPILFGGLVLLRHDLVSLGAIVGFAIYVGSFFEPVQSLTHLLAQAQAARSGLTRAVELLDTPVEEEPVASATLPPRGDLVLDAVRFGYEAGRAPVLEGFSLEVPAGQRVALVGASGAGKTTVAHLVARSRRPDGGRVLFGGVDLTEVSGEHLRSRIVTVSQEGHLFTGGVHENLAFAGAEEHQIAEMEQRLRGLGLAENLVTSPAPQLSAGQRQLVSLGRALLLDPAVLVLDEATADVDEETAQAVDRLLATESGRRTVVVVVHRMETAQQCERVVVLGDGQVLQDGAPGDLAAVEGAYRRMLAPGA